MEDRYKNIENNEIVKIIGDQDKFYLLNNGSKMLKTAFINKYSLINTSESVNPSTFFGEQQAPLAHRSTETQPIIQEQKINNFMTDNQPLDPDAFFKSSTIPLIGLDKIDVNSIRDDGNRNYPQPDSSDSIIRTTNLEAEKARLIEKYNIQNRQAQQQPAQGFGTSFINEDDSSQVDNLLDSTPQAQDRRKAL